MYAARRDEQRCKEWLEKAKELGALPNADDLREDSDLDLVRERDWFKALLDG